MPRSLELYAHNNKYIPRPRRGLAHMQYRSRATCRSTRVHSRVTQKRHACVCSQTRVVMPVKHGQLEKQGTGNGNGNGNGKRERERTTDGAQNGIDMM